jgi:acyl carrier protein
MELQLTSDLIKAKLRDIISVDLDMNISRESISDTISLYEDGLGLDSISVVNLIVLIEKKFDFSFTDEELNYDLFSSLNHLATVISGKLQ